jgi:ABC-type dipeptide/oligopeptide/nickel transport system ATPase component
VLGLSVLQLLPRTARISSGNIRWCGHDLVGRGDKYLEAVRGRGVAMVFQNAVSSLNPALTVGRQFRVIFKHRMGLVGSKADGRAETLLSEAGINETIVNRVLDSYPSQLSGGMAQRVAIAMALSCEPRLLIADEPTTGLDTISARGIINLLARLRTSRRLAILLISHDLPVVASIADRLSVMRSGRVVESNSVEGFFSRPETDYGRLLLESALIITGRHGQA